MGRALKPTAASRKGVENGTPLRERMKRARVDEADILESARQSRGIERMEQIKYAVLEVSGQISIIPED